MGFINLDGPAERGMSGFNEAVAAGPEFKAFSAM
jgi:hypothetical protein